MNGESIRFSGIRFQQPEERHHEHGGRGTISFRRLLDQSSFGAPVDFVDYTVVPPGSVIGLHEHDGNDELYFVVDGSPMVSFAGEECRLMKGDIAVVRSGEAHSLNNDTASNVSILVVQIRYSR